MVQLFSSLDYNKYDYRNVLLLWLARLEKKDELK
jgi:hypothetical protein